MRLVSALLLVCAAGCSGSSSDSSNTSNTTASNETSASSSSGGERASTGSQSTTRTTQESPPPPPPPPPPATTQPSTPPGRPPPRFTEMQAYLRADSRGMRCFQNNIIMADLSEAFTDIDLDGDGQPERVFQFPDCIAVSARNTEGWGLIALAPRQVQRDVELVTVRAATRNGQRVVEITDTRGTNREVSRWRWSGTDLVQAQ